MGADSVLPFIENPGKWVVLLALTSNDGASDFQFQEMKDGRKLYESVIEKSMNWGTDESLMFVVGATMAKEIEKVRELAPNHFFLVPGVGAQGGKLEDVVKYGSNNECGLLVNSSRGIIYASNGVDFGKAAREEAFNIQKEMALYVEKFN